MDHSFLHRDEAPFGAELWQQIDATVVGAAKSVLTGRKFLALDGPHGLAMSTLDSGDVSLDGAISDQVGLEVGCSTPLVQITAQFDLPMRMLAAYVKNGYGLDLQAVVRAAQACARQEDQLVFYGNEAAGIRGLLNTPGVQSMALRPWDKPGEAIDDVLQAVTRLDQAGFAGPYSAALAPALFNQLFRRYSDSDLTGMEHLKQLVTAGIYKAPTLGQGMVLMPAAAHLAALVVGQDMAVSFAGPQNRAYQFCISETVALRLNAPAAVCLLQ